MSKLSKDELAELQRPDSWDETDSDQPAAKPTRAVVSVAFSQEDFEAIVAQARQRGMKTSEFIRRAALEHLARRPDEAHVVSVTGAVYTEYVSISAPKVKTEAATVPEPPIYATT